MTQGAKKFTSWIYQDEETTLPRPAPKVSSNVMDLFSLKGKVAVVTGSARGLGSYIAEAYAQAGADVIIWDYKDAPHISQNLIDSYGIKSKSYGADVSKAEIVKETIEDIEKTFGTIDIFVANAGVAWETGSILNEENDDDKNWKRVIDVDFNGVYYCAKNVGKIFKKNKKGSFIVTGSMSGSIVNVPNFQMPYNAAKAGAVHLAKSLAVEFAPFNARCNAVSPGYLDTGLSDFLPDELRARWWGLIPMGREGLPQELVGIYLYLASDASTYCTGSNMIVDGGFTCP
ncbi:unnamed protein product [[Candida] boidinii]|uniref:Unnamed protein product n=2 Tax=Candida boidinii TaxID=5477 RepID=A0A9W6WFC6_CANBO|nr:sorbose reductase activity protein [[Candida] boidinii]GME67083.1 unnamed protein product [[Candida] boidinii]GMF65369.1 unnamed protein product [[Candida] boidinii]